MTLRDLPVRGRIVAAVFRAEMTSVLRDRRTLITGLLVPILLYPLAGVGMAQGDHHLGHVRRGDCEPRLSRRRAGRRFRALARGRVRLRARRGRVHAGAAPDRAWDAVLDVPVGAAAALDGDAGFHATVRYSSERMRGPLAVQRVPRFARAAPPRRASRRG